MRSFQNFFSLKHDTPLGGLNVSLVGPTEVYQGTTANYQITNFDSFSEYVVQGPLNPILTDKTINVTVDPETLVGDNALDIIIAGITNSFNINVLRSYLSMPVLITPVNNAIEVSLRPTLSISSLSTSEPSGLDTHLTTRWEIATDSGFQNLVWTTETSGAGRVSTLVTQDLPADASLYARVKALGTVISSDWSNVVAFRTASVIAPTLNASGAQITQETITRQFTLTTSAYNGPGTHTGSEYQLLDAQGTVVWFSGKLTGAGLLSAQPFGLGFTPSPNTTYYARARHESSVGGWSSFGASSEVMVANGLITTYNTSFDQSRNTSWTVNYQECRDPDVIEYYSCIFEMDDGVSGTGGWTCDPNDPYTNTPPVYADNEVIFLSAVAMPRVCTQLQRITSANTTFTTSRQTSRYTEF